MGFQTLRATCIAVAVLAIAACSNASKAPTTAPSVQGESSKAGAFLAYEHAVTIGMSPDAISGTIGSVRSACTEARFGACSVLRIDENTGEYRSDAVVVRIVPEGVEPLVKLAASGGTIGSRSTKAEDRADVVADIARKTDLLAKQREKLSEYEARKDLSLADRLALVRELASIEQQLDELAAALKNENRRIETNLLTLNFHGSKEVSRWSKVSNSFSGFIEQFLDGASEVIDVVAYGLPFVLLAFPFALMWRWLWRRVTAKARR
jgi:hypothetical protein